MQRSTRNIQIVFCLLQFNNSAVNVELSNLIHLFVLGMTLNCLHRVISLPHPGANDLSSPLTHLVYLTHACSSIIQTCTSHFWIPRRYWPSKCRLDRLVILSTTQSSALHCKLLPGTRVEKEKRTIKKQVAPRSGSRRQKTEYNLRQLEKLAMKALIDWLIDWLIEFWVICTGRWRGEHTPEPMRHPTTHYFVVAIIT